MAAREDTAMEDAERYAASQSDDGRYRLLIESIRDYAIYMLSLDGTVTSWNPGAKRFKGYEAEEIIGKNFSQFYSAEDRAAGLPQRGLDTAEREGKFEAEGWRYRKDGTSFWAHVLIDPIRAPNGTLIGFAKITRDLTDRLNAEEDLKASEQQFRLLVAGVTDYAIYMLNPGGIVSSWNQGAQRIKGYLPQEIIGQHFSQFYTPEDAANGDPSAALQTALSQGKFEKEGLRVRKDGSRFWASVVIDPIYTTAGKFIGFAKITRDISERRKSENALELAREALFQSQKMDAVGQLTGGVAHDFNNLLSAVMGSLELLRRRLPDDPKALRLIDNAMEGAQRGATLTQRMLAFARRQELKAVPVDVAVLIEGMAGLLRSSIGATVDIVTDVPGTLSLVKADENQLELALLNLTVNARDAMPDGGVININAREGILRKGVKPVSCVCVSIVDKGEGMDEGTLLRALEPFFTTKGIGKGTGLGLSMVHGMVQQLGGDLILKSKKSEGTTVELWLPVADEGEIAASGIGELPAQAAHKKLTVLAVDDDHLVLLNTSAMLDDLGHTVLEANSGAIALKMLQREGNIDLVITDQAMPGMTGVQLGDAIRTTHPDMPIILATGYAELPVGTKTDLPRLSKPFRQQDLIEIIAAVMPTGTTPATD